VDGTPILDIKGWGSPVVLGMGLQDSAEPCSLCPGR
jgi:hypothetical protein